MRLFISHSSSFSFKGCCQNAIWRHMATSAGSIFARGATSSFLLLFWNLLSRLRIVAWLTVISEGISKADFCKLIFFSESYWAITSCILYFWKYKYWWSHKHTHQVHHPSSFFLQAFFHLAGHQNFTLGGIAPLRLLLHTTVTPHFLGQHQFIGQALYIILY